MSTKKAMSTKETMSTKKTMSTHNSTHNSTYNSTYKSTHKSHLQEVPLETPSGTGFTSNLQTYYPGNYLNLTPKKYIDAWCLVNCYAYEDLDIDYITECFYKDICENPYYTGSTYKTYCEAYDGDCRRCCFAYLEDEVIHNRSFGKRR